MGRQEGLSEDREGRGMNIVMEAITALCNMQRNKEYQRQEQQKTVKRKSDMAAFNEILREEETKIANHCKGG